MDGTDMHLVCRLSSIFFVLFFFDLFSNFAGVGSPPLSLSRSTTSILLVLVQTNTPSEAAEVFFCTSFLQYCWLN